MENLSLNESSPVAHEADEICWLAESLSARLRLAEAGFECRIGDINFRCSCSDKSVIFRVWGKHEWYLKYTSHEWVDREIAGALAVRSTLADYPAYRHPHSVRISRDHAFTLYSCVRGTSFNSRLYSFCFLRLRPTAAAGIRPFRILGQTIGKLHSYHPEFTIQASNPTALSYLQAYLKNASKSDGIARKIQTWVDEQCPPDENQAWIHGNIKSEDIFFADGKVSLIDFGTSGLGSPFEDLVGLCTHMLLCRHVPMFPWKRARTALTAFLSGYSEERDLNQEKFANYLTRRVCRYYFTNIAFAERRPTLTGMPLDTTGVILLLTDLLEGNYETALSGIQICG